MGDARAVPRGRRRRARPSRGRAARDLPACELARAAAWPAGPALSRAAGRALRLLPPAARFGVRRRFRLRLRLLQAAAGNRAWPDLPLFPRLSRQHGAGDGGGRRLFLHGGLGVDGAIAILLCFGALQAGAGDYTFEHIRALQPSASWATAAFLLALFGFGAKSGIVPLHVWLPE